MPWKWYTEINGVDGATQTTEFSGTLNYIHRTDLTDNPQDRVLYFAELEEDPGDNGIYQLEAESAPGTDNITVSPQDAAPGSGHEVSEISLALTAAGLDTATAGAALSLGTQLTSGASNAQPVYVRVENAETSPGNSTELSLARNAVVQSEI